MSTLLGLEFPANPEMVTLEALKWRDNGVQVSKIQYAINSMPCKIDLALWYVFYIVQGVGVDHGRLNILMPKFEQDLHFID